MGGMNTYAKRYSLMSLFDIEDNTIDFDSHDNTKQPAKNTAIKPENSPELPWLNKANKAGQLTPEWIKVTEALKTGYTLEQVKLKYKLSKEIKSELETLIKS
jgi:hypothetical protein